MIQAGILAGRMFLAMHKAWKMAAFGTAVATALTTAGMTALAADPPPYTPSQAKYIKYDYFQNNFSPVYPLAWKVMKPLYKDSRYDTPNEFLQTNPMIGIGEFDLNNDKIPEVISFPVEDEVEAGMYCTADSVCPNYVIDVSGEEPVLLGKIPASSIDRGENITNGFWDLKAYTHDWTTPRTSEFDLYVFDKKTKSYQKADVPPAPTR
jgi:hypothetical protein